MKNKQQIKELVKQMLNSGREMQKIQHFFEHPAYREILLADTKEQLQQAVKNFKEKYGEGEVQELLSLLRVQQTEITTTGTTAGSEEYNTPYAFSKSEKDKEEKDKEITDVTDYELVKEEISSRDWKELKKLIRMEIASLYFDLYKKRNVWMK